MLDPLPEIVVPGSTSNLGPGFDALSVALQVYLRLRIVQVAPDDPGSLETVFDGPSPCGENRIVSAFQLACRRFGPARAGLRVRVSTGIPMAAGLGSSAAAIVGGVRLYEAASSTRLSTGEILALATELEGHPDNAAASLLGGITVSCQYEDGRVVARSWNWPADIRFVIATPRLGLETKKARGVLPGTVTLRDAIANLQRALLLVRALDSGDYADLREALKDRWHQPARSALVPGLAEALAIDHPAVLGVCLSGAGPSVLALAAPGRDDEAADVLAGVYRRLGVPCDVRNLAAHPAALDPAPLEAAGRETAT
jgi:homoserine kinase